MAKQRSDLLQGTLEMMVLKTLAQEPTHGWGLSLRIEQMSQGVFCINQGSLYPALQRLKRKGLITGEWRPSENNRRAKYYQITHSGMKQLEREMEEWGKISGAVNRVLTVSFMET
jgi:PadR family transcriptional regulator PadR